MLIKILNAVFTAMLIAASGLRLGHNLTSTQTGLVEWLMLGGFLMLAFWSADHTVKVFQYREKTRLYPQIDTRRFKVINFDAPEAPRVSLGQTINAMRADAKRSILNGHNAAEQQQNLLLLDFLDASVGNVDIHALKSVVQQSFAAAWAAPFDEPDVVLAHLGRDEAQSPACRRAANWLWDALREGAHDTFFLISLSILLDEVLAEQKLLSTLEATKWSYSN